MTPGQRAYVAFYIAHKLEGNKFVDWAAEPPVAKAAWEAAAGAARKRAPAKPKSVYPDCYWVSEGHANGLEIRKGKKLPDGTDWRKRNRVRMADGLLHFPSNTYPTKAEALRRLIAERSDRVRREERDTRDAKRALVRAQRFAEKERRRG